MPDTWIICPSANKLLAKPCLTSWKKQGYKIAVLGESDYDLADAFLYIPDKEYKGTVWAFNKLFKHVIEEEKANLVVAVCDDLFPDENFTADDLHERYLTHWPNYEGVVEPSKGKEGGEHFLVVSPIIGRNYYDTHGYHHERYYHFFADQDFYHKTNRLGLLKIDPTIEYNHQHWTKTKTEKPPHMHRWRALHAEDKKTFAKRQEEGFK